MQTVEQRVGAGEFAGAVHYRMVYAAVHVLGGEFACVAFDLRIAETVHGESWLPPSIGAVGGVDIALLATA